MKLTKLLAVENDCYKAGRKIVVKGLMLHSTGANNPKLSRYVGPDDGVLGLNKNNNHWNNPGIEKCVHGFIGKDKNGEVKTYQILDWNHRGWHAGGKANDTHIGVEICEDNLQDGEYFAAAYTEAVELFVYLCKLYGLTEKDIIDHSEGHKLGVASNHGDVMHWFPKHGKSMDTFRADVKQLLDGGKVEVVAPAPAPTPAPQVDITQLAKEVIDGKHGSGEARKKALGANYDAVQKKVNELLGSKQPTPAPVPQVNIDQLARETINGKYGSGETRKKFLGANYDAVQKRVNEILTGRVTPARQAKTISQLADEVLKGLHGSGDARRKSLGSRYAEVQKEINRRMK